MKRNSLGYVIGIGIREVEASAAMAVKVNRLTYVVTPVHFQILLRNPLFKRRAKLPHYWRRRIARSSAPHC